MDLFKKRLQLLLDEKNMNQKELAKKVGVTEVTISRYMNGERKPRIEIVNKLAEVLGTTTDYLLGNSDVKNPYEDKKDFDVVDEFLLDLKKEMEKQGLQFDETSPQELIETYKLLKEFKERTKGD